jgi:glycosyltransferase involved in cell wall biosynthesis
MTGRGDLTVIVNWRDRSHPQAGGAEEYCEQVARHLARDGHRVVLLTAAAPGAPRSEQRDGYRVVRRGSRFGVYPLALAWLWTHRRQISRVLDSQNGIPFFSPLVLRRSTPVVLCIHHVHQQQFGAYFSPRMARVGRWLEGPGSRWVYGHRSVVAVSPSTRQDVRRVLGLPGVIHVAIPGCAPATDLPAAGLAAAGPGGRARAPRVVTVGRLVEHKRIGLVIDAFATVLAAHPDAELHIVGDGPDRGTLEHQARALGRSVTFHGSVPAEERDRLVRSSWLAVSTGAGEGWGIAAVEANSQGRPVVAFRVPGLRDSVRHGETGWLLDDGGDLGARLADSLAILADPEVAEEWAARAVAWANRTNWATTAAIIDVALEAERGRLAHVERRQPTDLTSRVMIPSALIPPDWEPSFRSTDRVVRTIEGLAIVLPGTDLADARRALRRAGLPASVVADPRLQVRVARPADLVDPAAGVRLLHEERRKHPRLSLVDLTASSVS